MNIFTKKRTHRRASLAIVTAGLLLATAACSADTGDTGGPSPDAKLDKVTILSNYKIVFAHYADLYGGIKAGLFEDEGIDMTIQAGQTSSETVTQVAAGTAQFGIVDPVVGMVAMAKGAGVTFVASRFQSYTGSVCWTDPDKAIKTWGDLVGKTIGGAAGDAFITALPLLMEQNGVKPDINVVTMDQNAQQGALISGQIDLVPTNAVGVADKQIGLKAHGKDLDCFRFGEHGAKQPGFALLVNNKVMQDDPDLVQRVVDGYAASVLWGLKNKDAAIDAFMAAYPDRDREAVEIDFENSIAFLGDASADKELGVFALVPQNMEGAAKLAELSYDSVIDYKSTYTNEFVEALPKELRNP